VRSSSSGSSCPVAIEHLSVSQNDPHLLLAGCSDQMLRLFDVRAGATPALSVHAGRAPLAGMVLEPCGRSGAALTGSATGELRFLDLRLAAGEGGGDGGSSCVVRSVQAHSTGGMSVLAAHPNAPLLATATAASASVVKVWTDTGDLVGAIKSAAPQRMAPVTAMAWHPYNLYLGAGGKDSVASVFIVDHVPPPVGSVGGQAAAAVSPGSQPSSVGLPPQPPQYSAGTAGSAGSGQQPQHSQQAQQQAQQQHGGAPSSPSVAAAGAHAGS
jgi:regulator-associated protein of mTOR